MLFACKRSYTKTATKNNLVEPWLNAHHGHNQRKFSWGTEVTFGDDYDVIDVQSTMMRLFCYDLLTNSGGGIFFIVGGHVRPQGEDKMGICPLW